MYRDRCRIGHVEKKKPDTGPASGNPKVSLVFKGLRGTHGFDDPARLDTTGAHLLSSNSPGGQLNADVLKIWIESPPRLIVGVRDVVTEHRAFAADVAFFSHI